MSTGFYSVSLCHPPVCFLHFCHRLMSSVSMDGGKTTRRIGLAFPSAPWGALFSSVNSRAWVCQIDLPAPVWSISYFALYGTSCCTCDNNQTCRPEAEVLGGRQTAGENNKG